MEQISSTQDENFAQRDLLRQQGRKSKIPQPLLSEKNR